MGNFRSGRTGPRGGRRATAELPEARLSYGRLSVASARGGPRVLPEGQWAEIVYGPRDWRVDIATTPLAPGGARRWLVCPSCSARRVALYVDCELLACRTCLGLRYASEHETEKCRAIRRAARTRSRLRWPGGVLDPEGRRPKGMHEKTCRALTGKYRSQVSTLISALDAWVRRVE